MPWRRRRKRGRGWLTGYSKVGQRSSQQGRSSRTQSGIKCVLMCERIVLVLRQTDLPAPLTRWNAPDTNPAAVEPNPNIHSGNIWDLGPNMWSDLGWGLGGECPNATTTWGDRKPCHALNQGPRTASHRSGLVVLSCLARRGAARPRERAKERLLSDIGPEMWRERRPSARCPRPSQCASPSAQTDCWLPPAPPGCPFQSGALTVVSPRVRQRGVPRSAGGMTFIHAQITRIPAVG